LNQINQFSTHDHDNNNIMMYILSWEDDFRADRSQSFHNSRHWCLHIKPSLTAFIGLLGNGWTLRVQDFSPNWYFWGVTWQHTN